MRPFNEEKALAGAKLVTRDGREVWGFAERGVSGDGFPYLAFVDSYSNPHSYGSDGKWRGTGDIRDSKFDLFLADDESDAPEEKPATLTPRAQIMAMLAAGEASGFSGDEPDAELMDAARFYRRFADMILRVDAEE